MRVDRVEFHDAMKQMARVADDKSALPILRHVLIAAKDGRIQLRATDLEDSLTCSLTAEGKLTACLPAKLLCQLVKPESKRDAGDVCLEAMPDNKVSVQVDGLSTVLMGLDPNDFPMGIGEDLNWSLLAMWPAKDLRESLKYVLTASSRDETRQNLQSVFFNAGHMVCTDGHRLHLASIPSELETSLLVPATAAETLRRVLSDGDQVVIARSDDHIRFGAGQWQLDARLMDESYPDTKQVVPEKSDQETRLVVETKVFSKALSRVSRLSSEKQVKFVVNGTFTITSHDYDLGQAKTVVPTVENNHEGKDLVIGYNVAYLLDALKTKDEAVELRLSDPLSPVRMDMPEAGRLAVVMPIRI